MKYNIFSLSMNYLTYVIYLLIFHIIIHLLLLDYLLMLKLLLNELTLQKYLLFVGLSYIYCTQNLLMNLFYIFDISLILIFSVRISFSRVILTILKLEIRISIL